MWMCMSKITLECSNAMQWCGVPNVTCDAMWCDAMRCGLIWFAPGMCRMRHIFQLLFLHLKFRTSYARFCPESTIFCWIRTKKLEPRMFDSAPGAWFHMEIRAVEIRTVITWFIGVSDVSFLSGLKPLAFCGCNLIRTANGRFNL